MRCRSAVSAGLTLTEVLVALFILGTALLAMVLAHQRYLRQIGDLADQQAAIEQARLVMAQALARDVPAAGVERGQVPGRPEWQWSMTVGREPSTSEAGLYRIEVIVCGPERNGEPLRLARLATVRWSGEGAARGGGP